jgi:hypothetical protein
LENKAQKPVSNVLVEKMKEKLDKETKIMQNRRRGVETIEEDDLSISDS